MKKLVGPEFDSYRVVYQGYAGDENAGAFVFRRSRPDKVGAPFNATGALLNLRVIAVADGEGWDHVSVSYEDRVPSWEDMEWVKRRFFHPHEVAMQLHVAEEDHINRHPYVLHIWRPCREPIPLPPKSFV